ncbi:MAG: DNA gyrase subunit A [Bdellovibrionales bacterium]|nr:DNA gyrase subunit A [Bdellovibrionales bacterium]
MDNETQSLITIEDEMQQSYMDYAMSVIVGRALPDVRDGLKPVQRRILYAMLGEGLVHNRKHSKCAGVVGEVLKRLHPHGDSSVYDALVRLAQPWSLRYPLVDGQGNFGSIDGDPAAAYRYTECRMSAISSRLLEDIDKDTVDFIPNFDDTNEEPVVLPSAVPNLLVNGADGIAVGMATHMPPHNLGEVVAGAVAYLDNPQIPLDELMEYIPGPDFPTGGIIYGRGPIISAYARGRGVIRLRARAEIETLKISSREVEAIVITEIPYQLNKSVLLEKIAALVNEKSIEGVSKLRDESDRKGMRIVIELKKDATAEIVMNQLFKLTPLQSSFGVINLAIVEGRPVVCSIFDLLRSFLDHRRDVVVRRTQFQLRKAQERMHILEGFRIALLNLDDVIQLIKGSETPKDAKEGLRAKYELSDIQSQAILDLRLQKLTGMERLAIEREHEDLGKEIEQLELILSSSDRVNEIIRQELVTIKDEYGDARRTEIVDDGGEIDLEDLIEDEQMVVTVSHQGYVKRLPVDTYKQQRRGGKGVTGASTKNEDFVEQIFVASSLADLLVFTNLGRVYWQKVYAVPAAGRAARGRALVNLLSFRPGEKMSAILPVSEFADNHYLIMATKQGYVKKIDLMSFERVRKSGVVACTLAEDDQLIGVKITHGNDDVLLATRSGMSIRFSENDVRPMGRTARGVRGINLSKEDEVVGMVVVAGTNGSDESDSSRMSESSTLLTACENGYGKRTLISEYRAQNRGGKGLIDIQTVDRNGPVIGACAVSESCDVMVIASSGKIIRMAASGISVIGRNTKGVRLVDLDEGEKIVALSPVREDDEEVEGEEDES